MESNKVRLRAMEPEDLDLLYEIENDIETWHVGAVNVPYSRYLLHDYIAHATGDIYADRQLRLIIEDKKGNSVGLIDLVDFDPQHSRAEVGIILQTKHRRRGYATEAMKLILDYARKVIHLHQVYAIVSVNNQPSLNLLKSLGFREYTTMKDWLREDNCFVDAQLLQYFL
jgi:acetyltransferase, GNAT family